MKRYNVYLCPILTVKVSNVEAESVEEAIAKAEEVANLHKRFEPTEAPYKGRDLYIEECGYMDALESVNVVESDDMTFDTSRWFDGNLQPYWPSYPAADYMI